MAKGGRIIFDKTGKEIARHHIDPHSKDPVTAEQRKLAHGYELGAGEAFKALTPEELAERSTVAKPAAAPAAAAPAAQSSNSK